LETYKYAELWRILRVVVEYLYKTNKLVKEETIKLEGVIILLSIADASFLKTDYSATLNEYETYHSSKSYPQRISLLLGTAACRYLLKFPIKDVFTPVFIAKELTLLWLRQDDYNYSLTQALFVDENEENRWKSIDEACRILLKAHRQERKNIEIGELKAKEICGWIYFILSEMARYDRKCSRVSYNDCITRMRGNNFLNDVTTGSMLRHMTQMRKLNYYSYVELLLSHYNFRSNGNLSDYLLLLMNHNFADVSFDESWMSEMAFAFGRIIPNYDDETINKVFFPFFTSKLEGGKGGASNSYSECYGEMYRANSNNEELLLKFLSSTVIRYHRAFSMACQHLLELMDKYSNNPIYIHVYCLSTFEKQTGILPRYDELSPVEIERLINLEEKALTLYETIPSCLKIFSLADIEGTLEKFKNVLNKIRQAVKKQKNKSYLTKAKKNIEYNLSKALEVKNYQRENVYSDEYIKELCEMPYVDYLKTDHWKSVRQIALQRAGYKCVLCGSTQNLDVHHNDYCRRGFELETDVTVVCRKCHEIFHGISAKNDKTEDCGK